MLRQKKPKLWISTYDNITHLLTRHTHKGLLRVEALLFEELLVLPASGTLWGLPVLQPVPFYYLVSLLLLLLALLFYWDYSSYVLFIWRIHKINGIENIISGYIFMRKTFCVLWSSWRSLESLSCSEEPLQEIFLQRLGTNSIWCEFTWWFWEKNVYNKPSIKGKVNAELRSSNLPVPANMQTYYGMDRMVVWGRWVKAALRNFLSSCLSPGAVKHCP